MLTCYIYLICTVRSFKKSHVAAIKKVSTSATVGQKELLCGALKLGIIVMTGRPSLIQDTARSALTARV